MSGTLSQTISGYHNTPQILSAKSPYVTITGTIKTGGTLPGGQISYGAVFGPGTGGITVTNLGLIDDTVAVNHNTFGSGGDAGIVLTGSGSVNNLGTILSKAGYGVDLTSGGAVTNSGSIIANRYGVHITPGMI